MIITTDQLKNIVLAGGSLVLDASAMTFSQIREVVVAASTSKAKLTFKKVSGYTAFQLAELATLAPTLLVFDLTS